ncbi:MAG: lysylphosphatidylglycerol synthase transmembrane domain-containing protein, partial [Acidobacteriota bacterium]
MSGKLSAIIKTIVTAVLFYLLFRKVDFQQFAAILQNARFDILLPSLAVLWLGHYICIYRWRMLMRPLMPVFSLARLFGIYCIGLFFNLAFPTAVGGDVVKMYYAGKPSRMYAESFAATFLDRDSGMLAMMIIACAGILIHPVEIPGLPVAVIVWLTLALFVFANAVIFMPSLHYPLSRLLRRIGLARIASKVDAISNAFQVMGRHPAPLLGSLLISTVNQLLVITFVWILGAGLRLDIPFVYYLVFIPVTTLISMIPISLNGMGLREYAFLSLFGAIGVAPESCIALGL